MRWSEEVELLLEEMRRVKQFLEWHARWWKGRTNRREGIERGLEEGLSAYVHRQASIRLALKENFEELWRSVDMWVATGEVPKEQDGE